ncbi:MAG: ABC transporter ATP-binding protein [Acidimicrobiales bacterium]
MTAPASLRIRLDGLTKVYPGSAAPAVEGLSLDLPAGRITALIGPSGCGKTTVLKMINRLIEPTAGTVVIGERDAASMPVHELRRGIGYVIQHVGLFPHRSVGDNIATVPRLLDWDRDRIAERVSELADLVGLAPELLTRYPAALSGGQQQRVGVARALAADPPILLMDEPYSAVDPIVRGRLQDDLLDLQDRLGKTIVLVTHDIDEAVKLGDRIALLAVGGRLEQFAAPDDLLSAPASPFVEEFVGGERTLRRMGLLTVDDIEVQPPFVVTPDLDAAEALRRMKRRNTGWVGVVGGDDRLLGWAAATDLERVGKVGEVELRAWSATVRSDTPLREVIDLIIASRTRVAAVVDPAGRLVGTLGFDHLSEQVRAAEPATVA